VPSKVGNISDSTVYASRFTQYRGSLMISICDSDLVGRKLDSDGIGIVITKSYWQKELVSSAEAERLLQKCNIANLAGKRIVEMALRKKLANPASVKFISGVPFLMIFKMEGSSYFANRSGSEM